MMLLQKFSVWCQTNPVNKVINTAVTCSVSVPATSVHSKRGGRPRGRPRGSGTTHRSRGRGSIQKSLSAAEAAAAVAAKKAAYAAYGYSFTGEQLLATELVFVANWAWAYLGGFPGSNPQHEFVLVIKAWNCIKICPESMETTQNPEPQ